jgi:hypothetical protein
MPLCACAITKRLCPASHARVVIPVAQCDRDHDHRPLSRHLRRSRARRSIETARGDIRGKAKRGATPGGLRVDTHNLLPARPTYRNLLAWSVRVLSTTKRPRSIEGAQRFASIRRRGNTRRRLDHRALCGQSRSTSKPKLFPLDRVLGALGRVEDARDLAATFQSGEASAGGSFSPRRDRNTRCSSTTLRTLGRRSGTERRNNRAPDDPGYAKVAATLALVVAMSLDRVWFLPRGRLRR